MMSRIAYWAKAVIAVLLLILIVRHFGGFPSLVDLLAQLSGWTLLAVLVSNTLDRLLMTYKWIMLLRAHGAVLPLFAGTRIYCSSMIWGIFLPATVGADAIRVASTSRRGIATDTVLASVFMERILGVLASLLLGFLGLLVVSIVGTVPSQITPLFWIGGVLLAVGIIVMVLSLSDRAFDLIHNRLLGRFRENWLAARFRRLHERYQKYRPHRGRLLVFFLLSCVEQLVPAVGVWLIARGLGLELSPLFIGAVVVLSFLVARVPVSLGGVGILEGALVFLLTTGGVDAPRALAIAVAARVMEIASWLPWWLTSLTGGERHRLSQVETNGGS